MASRLRPFYAVVMAFWDWLVHSEPVSGNEEGYMTREEIVNLVNNIEYKPGWGLTTNYDQRVRC